MRVDVFQVVALCCHSSAFLAGESESPPELLHTSTFLPVHEVLFERAAMGKLAMGVMADAVGPWLRRIKKEGVERLDITLEGCPLDPLSRADEPWGIITEGDIGLEIWQPEWKKRLRSHSDPSPWRVSYTGRRASRWNLKPPPHFSESAKHLSASLLEATQVHPKVAVALHEEHTELSDLFPTMWDARSREVAQVAVRVLCAVRSESWASLLSRGDLPLPEHSALSEKLWRASLRALEACVQLASGALAHPTGHNYRRAG